MIIHITGQLDAGGSRKAVYPRPGTVADLHRVLHQLEYQATNLVKTKIYFINIDFYIKHRAIDGIYGLWLVIKIYSV